MSKYFGPNAKKVEFPRSRELQESPAKLAALTTDAADRKATPIATGFIDYFPDAIAAVARCSMAGNRQHHADKPLHWDKSKSTDEADCLMRHFVDRGTLDTDGQRHSAKVAWRALALLQREIDAEKAGFPPEPLGPLTPTISRAAK